MDLRKKIPIHNYNKIEQYFYLFPFVPTSFKEAYDKWFEYSYMLLYKVIQATEEEKLLFRHVPFPRKEMYKIYYLLLEDSERSRAIIADNSTFLEIYKKIIDIPVVVDSIESLLKKVEIYAKWCEYFRIRGTDPFKEFQIINQIIEILTKYERRTGKNIKEIVQQYSCKRPDIIQNFLGQGETVLILCPSDLRKTSLAINFASVLTNRNKPTELFGKFFIKKSYRVGICSTENSLCYLAEIGKNFDDDTASNIYVYTGHFDPKDIYTFLLQYKIDILIIDSLSDVFAYMDVDEDSNKEVRQCLQYIQKIFFKIIKGLIIIHHKPPKSRITPGTNAVFEWVYVIFEIKSGKNKKFVLSNPKNCCRGKLENIQIEQNLVFFLQDNTEQLTSSTLSSVA